VFDTLTKAQQRQLRDSSRRIVRAVDPDDACLDGLPFDTAALTTGRRTPDE
jgi:hypothetical protein